MKLNILEKKLSRYIQGTASIAEMKQVETWLSTPHNGHSFINDKKKEKFRQRILFEVQHYTDYPISFPRKKEVFKTFTVVAIKGVLIILTVGFIYFFAFHNW